MVSQAIKDIWAMGAVRCSECKEMKTHCAHGMCNKCYNKWRRSIKTKE